MEFQALGISGCFEIAARRIADRRGWFVKPFHEVAFRSHGLECDFREQYYSSSKQGVLRGMHFQTPPADHAKLVYCVDGEVLDVLLDIRKGSPTYGKHASVVLSANSGNAVYLPRGLAHGFYVVSKLATLVYSVSSVHSPDHDHGILWNSFGASWPTSEPILSPRDTVFPALARFDSPFVYERAALGGAA